jgi:hypothetical protein
VPTKNNVSHIDVYMSKTAGATDDLTVQLWDDSGGDPNSVIATAVIMPHQVQDTGSEGYVTCDFGNVTVVPNDTYHITFKSESSTASGYGLCVENHGATGYTGGTYQHSVNQGSSWVKDTGYDLIFKEYYFDSGSFVRANISLDNQTKNNSVRANISKGATSANSVRASIISTQSKAGSTRANISSVGQQANAVRANISKVQTQANSVRASISITQTNINAVRANISVGTLPLTDDFGDASLDNDKWELGRHATESSVEETGVLKVKNDTTLTSGYVHSRHLYIPQYTTLEVKINQHSTDGGFKLCATDPNGHQWDVYSEADWYNHQLIAGTALSPNKRASGVGPTQIGGDSATLTVPYWARIRIDNDTIYFDYRDNLTDQWTNISSEAWSLGTAITSPHYVYLTGYNTQTTGVPHFDDFNWQEGVQTEKNNAVRANITTSPTKDNSVRASIKVEGNSPNNVRANILRSGEAKNNSIRANIKDTYTSDVSVRANIENTYSQPNSTRANIEAVQTKTNSTRANITKPFEQASSVRANIRRTETQNNSVRAQILVEGSKANSVRANISREDQESTNAVRANILTTYWTGATYDWQLSYLGGANRGWQGTR